jgi:lipopolysaccharide biosynthesis glycosyltransferase/glycosyltransferase involved in cell wall biosynthesis
LYIKQCLESLTKQSIKIKVIIVDDGSTDKTESIVHSFTDKLDIEYIKQQNKGAGAARNKGLDKTQTEFVHFLDSDDWLEPNAYAILVKTLDEHHSSEFVTFLYNRYDNITELSRKIQLFPIEENKIEISNHTKHPKRFLQTSVVPWNKLYRTSFLKKNDIRFDEIHVANDRTFYYKTISKASNITLLSRSLINYRTNNTNSLVGKDRGNHFHCILTANKNIYKTTDHFNETQRKLIFEVNTLDALHFYEKCDQTQKFNNINILKSYLNESAPPFTDEELSKFKWSAKYQIMKKARDYEKDPIPIVMATNNNYAPYVFTTIESISQSNNNTNIDIFIFHSGISDTYIEKLNQISNEKIRVHPINVSAIANLQTNYTRAHYSVEMYYRILIPELFDFCKKVLYLDCDLVVNKPIQELYSTDIENQQLAGAINFCNESMHRWIKNELKLKPEYYINSGVILINTTRFIESNSKSKCFQLLKNKKFLACPDQDMLNVACEGEIKILDPGWNFQWHHGFSRFKTTETLESYLNIVADAKNKQYITHYTSGIKAWSHPAHENGEKFWKHARNTPVYNEILKNNINKKISRIQELLQEMSNNGKSTQ